ncbi:DUF748 domain-containing protein [Sedimenticola thiotaurini]|uniref:DUF748 domain-containing protein n=1 Tax=Sedimenticola thiotaurini TaxID=1543721 RepID=A0A0F7JYJ9_9GAMM|nr:DUF748 domain-containing protein [Sedimenticola thiotaurini]AKH21416.1 hypothetical protein AAY24_14830 [Sedimenticola thiotaurini]
MTEAPDNKHKRRHGLIITLSILLILVIATLSLLPLGINYALKEWIRQQGGERVSVANVDFNPFTATLRLDELRVTNQGEEQLTLPRLDLQLAWAPLFSKQLVITGLELSGVTLKLIQNGTQSQIQIGGMLFPLSTEKAPTETTPWAVHLNRFSLQEALVDYQAPQLTTRIQVTDLLLTDIATDNPTGIAQVALQGSIDQAPITLQGNFTPFADTPSFDGEVRIDSLALDGYAKLAASQLNQLTGKLSMDGTLLLSITPSGTPQITHNGNISLADYQIGDQKQAIAGSSLAWQGQLKQNADNLSIDGGLTSSALRFDMPNEQISYNHQGLEWQGSLTLASDDIARKILSSSRLHIQSPDIQLADNQASLKQIELSLEKATLSLAGESMAAQLPGSLKLTGTKLTTPTQELTNASFSWQGDAQLNRDEKQTAVTLDGTLSDGPAQLRLLEKQAAAGLGDINWQGRLELVQNGHDTRISPSGDLSANALEASDQQTGLQLLALDSLTINGLAGDSADGLTATHIDARAITIGGTPASDKASTPAMLALHELQIRQPSYSASHGLQIDRIEANGLTQVVIRQSDKQLNLQRLADVIQRMTGQTPTQNEPPASQPSPITIGQVTLTGENRISFEDRTTDPVYQLLIKPEQFRLEGITNTPADQPATLVLKGILDKNTTLNLDGDVALFAAQPTFAVKGRIEGLELPPLSAYTIPLLGYQLQSGEANSDIQLSAKAGQVDGNSDLTLNQLEVEPLDADKMAAMQQQLSIPLETALGMLKDKNNRIQLSLPISGAMDNIQVDPSDAINQAIGRAMKKGAKTYLATALFPFGTLLTLVEIAGDAAAKIQLDPIPFAPGSSRLNPDQHAYLDKIAELLNERPEVYVRLCGVTTASDIEALQEIERERLLAAAKSAQETSDEKEKRPDPIDPAPIEISQQQLNQLAGERTSSIEHYLSEAHQVKAERLISCQPRIEKGAEKEPAPRVDLLI